MAFKDPCSELELELIGSSGWGGGGGGVPLDIFGFRWLVFLLFLIHRFFLNTQHYYFIRTSLFLCHAAVLHCSVYRRKTS